jgi:hypothetical protein
MMIFLNKSALNKPKNMPYNGLEKAPKIEPISGVEAGETSRVEQYIAEQKERGFSERAAFIRASLEEPAKILLEEAKKATSFDDMTARIAGELEKTMLVEKANKSPHLGNRPMTENEIKLTIAFIVEGIRRKADADGDEKTEEMAENAIVFLTGKSSQFLGNVVYEAALEKAGGDEKDEDLKQIADLIEKAGM